MAPDGQSIHVAADLLAGRHCGHLVGRGRDWDHEYHDCLSDGANAGNWYSDLYWSTTRGYSQPVSHRSADLESARRDTLDVDRLAAWLCHHKLTGDSLFL